MSPSQSTTPDALDARSRVRAWVHARLVQPLLAQLRQGLSPEKLALSVAMGVALGCFPVLGATTALCVVAAVLLRLNHPAIQVANYGAGPLQILFFIPLMKLGDAVFSTPSLPLDVEQLQHHFAAGALSFLRLFWTSVWHAMVAWVLLTPPAVAVMYVVLKPVMARVAERMFVRPPLHTAARDATEERGPT